MHKAATSSPMKKDETVVINNIQTNTGSTTPPPAPATGVPVSLTTPNLLVKPWSTGLFDCCNNCGNCFITCICPCITFGDIANILDKGYYSRKCCCFLYSFLMLAGCSACLLSCCYRRKMRFEYRIEESNCPDCLIHCCCEPCALCQMYRELKKEGFDMQLGYKKSMQLSEPTMQAPAVPETMSRP